MKKIIIYGFSKDDILKMQNIIKFISSNISYITVSDDDFDKTLNEVINEGKFEFNNSFSLNEKIVIFSNIVSKEIDIYFKLLKKKISNKIMFATVTQTSINMKLTNLFNEFIEEREYFNKNK